MGMGNLYEHTLVLEQIRDLVILDSKGKPSKDIDFKDKLSKLPKYLNPIDEPGGVFWYVEDQPVKKKNDKKIT